MKRISRMPLERILFVVAMCWISLLVLIGCNETTPQPSPTIDPRVGDGGFLSGEPCGPPCFWGITPGITDEARVVEVAGVNGIGQQCEFFNREPSGGVRNFACPFFGVLFRWKTDVVQYLSFTPAHNITVQQVIAKYGEPDAVQVGNIGSDKYPDMAMDLFYTRIHTILRLATPKSRTNVIVKESTEIQQINYYDEMSYQAQRANAKWKGYGTY